MTLTHSFDVGRLRCHCLDAGSILLDGGAMFGVVAKPLWEKHHEADELNRIRIALCCLLVEHDAGPVLIDTGVGNKENEKFVGIYGVENVGSGGRTRLEDSLAEVGFTPEAVRYVINTHLHFDHAGGNTFIEPDTCAPTALPPYRPTAQGGEGSGAPTALPPYRPTAHGGEGSGVSTASLSFPNATYFVQRGELEAARNPNERTAASYFPDNFEPVLEAGMWHLVDGAEDVLPGVSLLPTPGHTPSHQSVLLTDSGDTACFAGDCLPTATHVRPPWIMAYDLEPLVTLETKKSLLQRACADGWTVVFEHDPDVALARITRDSKSYACVPLDTRSG